MEPATITPAMLGSAEFLRDHGVRYAYVAGAMVKGIASAEMVTRWPCIGGFHGAAPASFGS